MESNCATSGLSSIAEGGNVSSDSIPLRVDANADDHFRPAEGCVPGAKLWHQQDQGAGPREHQKRSDSNDSITNVETRAGATYDPDQFLPHTPLQPAVLPCPMYIGQWHLNTLLQLPRSLRYSMHSPMFLETFGAVTAEKATLAAIRDMAVSITISDPALLNCPMIGCSVGFETLTGYNRSQIIGRNCRFLNKGLYIPKDVREQMRKAVAGGEFIGVIPNFRRDGERFQNLLHMTSVTVKGKRYAVGIQADVTNIKIDPRNFGHRAALKQAADRIFSETLDDWVGTQVEGFSIKQHSNLMKRRFPQIYARERKNYVRIDGIDEEGALPEDS